jgi:hypothetical protein
MCFDKRTQILIFLTHAVVIANKFNEYFVNVGPNLAKDIRKNDRHVT